MPKTPQLVCQHLENISGDLLEDFQDIIREYVSRRQGVYALYHDEDLYYVGLASNLSSRLKAHLGGKHAGQWNRFGVYLTIGDEGSGRFPGSLGAMVVEGPTGGESEVGSFQLTNEQRQRIWEHRDMLTGQIAEVKAMKVNASGAIRAGVFVRSHPSRSEAGLLMYSESLGGGYPRGGADIVFDVCATRCYSDDSSVLAMDWLP